MTQQLIKPDRLIAPNFLGAIITFLRNKLGETVYNGFRISEPAKNISFDSNTVQFYSLMENQNIISLWDCLQGKGLELTNLTPHDSKQNITKFKVSLYLPQEFLLEYGNDQVKNFCKDFVSENENQNQHDGLTNQQDQKQASIDNTQVSSVSSEESREIKKETPDTDQDSNSSNNDETIKTVGELVETVSLLKPKQKVRTISQFFKWYLEQNKVIDYEVLPRTAYKYQGNEPEFVVRILNTDDIPKVFKLLQSQGCDVDLVGEKKDGVRVKSLVIVDSTQTGKTEHKKVAKPNPKKAVKVSKKSKKKIFKKPTSKTVMKVKESEFKFFRERCLRELTEVVKDFLSKTERPKEQDLNIFQEMIELKKQELEVLNKLEKGFNELNKVRVLFLKKYSS